VGHLVDVVGVQPPHPARRGFAPRNPPFGGHLSWPALGVASPPSGGHLRCSLLGRCFAAQRWSPSVLTVGALLRRPAVVTFGAHRWGVVSLASGGHLRCSRLGRCFAAQRWSPSVLTVGALLRSPPGVTLGGRLFWRCFVAGSSVSCFLWAPVCRACHLGVVVEGRIVSWFGLFGGGFRHCQGSRRASEGAG
jgi:hypothetical protein